MIIYELIRNLPYEILDIIANFVSEEERGCTLIDSFINSSVIRSLNKSHYNYQYPYFYSKIKDNTKMKNKLIISIIRNKCEINFINYINYEGKKIFENKIVKYKNKKYKNRHSFIKELIINYNSEKLLPYLAEIN